MVINLNRTSQSLPVFYTFFLSNAMHVYWLSCSQLHATPYCMGVIVHRNKRQACIDLKAQIRKRFKSVPEGLQIL